VPPSTFLEQEVQSLGLIIYDWRESEPAYDGFHNHNPKGHAGTQDECPPTYLDPVVTGGGKRGRHPINQRRQRPFSGGWHGSLAHPEKCKGRLQEEGPTATLCDRLDRGSNHKGESPVPSLKTAMPVAACVR